MAALRIFGWESQYILAGSYTHAGIDTHMFLIEILGRSQEGPGRGQGGLVPPPITTPGAATGGSFMLKRVNKKWGSNPSPIHPTRLI